MVARSHFGPNAAQPEVHFGLAPSMRKCVVLGLFVVVLFFNDFVNIFIFLLTVNGFYSQVVATLPIHLCTACFI